ncbi:hypothetical protein IWW38_004130 [Coemansia aciculifera]|uniref:Uncharacterized protein n=1 Tax=Coemansia aciculifera TaxID=417176 RepID=A0ACC1M0F5_9FUNG|nr:hypothetical protein IWW38_004130 [Coemansia aciculifera]
MDRGLWEVTEKGVITPEESLLTEPESSTAAELRSAVKNEEAFLIIFVHLSPKLRKVYTHDKDAKKLWGILRTRYTETTLAMALRLLNEMNKLAYDGSIETMFDKYLSIKRQIASAGISYENLFNLGMLNALPLELRHSYIDILNEMELAIIYMFPSVGLLSQVDCPYKDKCGRGSLCLYRHRPEPSKKEVVKKEAEIKKPADATQEPPESQEPPAQEPPVHEPAAQEPVVQEPIVHEPAVQKVITQPSVPDDTTDWRLLTLNYDTTGPAYNSLCESTQALPQLKAIVGDKIGYAKRQRALTLIYEHISKTTATSPPWLAAKLAIECEDQIYRDSGPGTYHGKLSACLKDLRK